MTDKPPTPEVMDAELVPPTRIRRGNPLGNPDWGKGKPSPNPAGRPKVIREVRDLAQQHSIPAMQQLIDLMGMWRDAVVNIGSDDAPQWVIDTKMMKISKEAAETVLAYAVGKPATSLDVNVDGEVRVEDPLLAALRALAQPKKRDA